LIDTDCASGREFTGRPPERRRLFFGNGERGFDQVDGIAANHDFESAGLDDLVHVAIQKGEFVEPERELDGFGLTGIESDAAEAAQFLDGAGDGTDFFADVELDDFVAADFAGVSDVDADVCGAFGTDGIGSSVKAVVLERGIAEAPSEGEKRLRRAENVFALGGRLLVVVIGKLADRARNGDGKLAARIVVAEEDFGSSSAAFLAEIPAIENRGDVFG